MSFEYSKLLGKIVSVYGTQYNFARALSLSERSVSLKLNNHIPWTQPEISRASALLGIDQKDIPEYFFDQKVQNNWTI